jgi:RNA-directed DNA polymerase
MPTSYDRLCSKTLLYDAWKRLNKSNKLSHGLDNQTIQSFKDRLDENIRKISKKLRACEYDFIPLRAKAIQKDGGGVRILRIPAVRDRGVLTALKMLVAKRFRKFDRPCSYGYIPKRSRLDAILAVRNFATNGCRWVLEADIKKFFDTVTRKALLEKFIAEINIPSLLPIIRQAIYAEVGNLNAFGPTDKVFLMADSGILQGGVLSPLFANFYLSDFDQAMEKNGFNLVRYADDFVVMCQTKDRARAAYDLSMEVLEGKLGLQMHHVGDPGHKTRIFEYNHGFTFLGVDFRGEKVYPSEKAVDRFRNRIAEILKSGAQQNLLNTLLDLKYTIIGWRNAFRPYHSTEIFQELDEFNRKKLEEYLRSHELLAGRYGLGRKMIRFIGVPSLAQTKQRS